MTKKPHTVVLILPVMFVLLAGCIEKEKNEISTPTPAPTSPPTPTPSTTPTPTANKINLSMGNKINLSMDYNGRQIELANGQTFNVTLETNPSTTNMVGVPVMHTFQFEAINKGQTTIKIVYHRIWEKDVAPVNTFSVELFIR